MNHITQILANCKVSSANSSPPYRQTLSTEEVTPEFRTRRDSWGSKVLSKVKEYRNAIKDMVRERTPDSSGFLRRSLAKKNFSTTCRNLSPFIKRERISSSSSVPDIITSAKLADTEFQNESLRTPSSNLVRINDHRCHQNISVSDGNKRRNNQPLKYFSVNDTRNSVISISPEGKIEWKESSGARALARCTRQRAQTDHLEILRKPSENENGGISVKKRISAEPFLSYNGESCEIFWGNDSDTSSPKKKDCSGTDSLNSFLANEKKVLDELMRNEQSRNTSAEDNRKPCSPKKDRRKLEDDYESEVSAVKMKISAKPFVSYTRESTEPVWTEELDDSFSSKECASLDPLNSSIEMLEGPCSSSTFCEDSDIEINQSLAKACKALEDSGFENNASILRDNL